MTQPVVIHITPEGNIRFLQSEDAPVSLIGQGVTRRASNVEPVSNTLRYVFYGLRFLFGEKGRMAQFTRQWRCDWRVNLAPIGGSVLAGSYRNRAEAIDAEIAYLNKTFI